MKTRFLILAAAIALALPASATAQQVFDFNGQALVPAAVGGALSMHGVMFDPAPQTTPLPLDFANYQYTLVITGLTLDVDGNPQVYSGGAIAIYEDVATPADFAAPATFTDGAVVLSGVVNTLNRNVFTATLGSVTGDVDWTGGDHVDDLAPADQSGWTLVSGISMRAENIEPGYDEQWDGKVEPGNEIVPAETGSWGAVKKLF